MKLLSPAAFEAARQYIETRAPPLHVARFHFHFDNGSAEAVLVALAAYQNEDGGFGHGLDPDLQTPESSALCTTVACQILREIQVEPDEPLFVAAINYFLATVDRDEATWRIIPSAAQSSPHAPWWDQTDAVDRFAGFSLNPSAEILGYLYQARPQVADDLISLLADRISVALSDAQEIEMHDLLCCLCLVNTEGLPMGFRRKIQAELAALIEGTIVTDPAQWQGYGLRPVQVADRPDSPFLPGLEAAVAANLDVEIASQDREGCWSPTWDWGDAYPEAWAQARQEWAGSITVAKLLCLQRFARIA